MKKYSNEITSQRISDLLCTAFEGGSNYWATSPDNNASEVGAEYSFEAPLNQNGFFVIEDLEDDNKRYIVNSDSIDKGLQVMAENFGHHFQDFLNENYDACTGDVFLQCCVFGDVIYG